MKNVPLANGKGIAIVDDDDYERVSAHFWCLHRGGGKRQRLYAEANIKRDGKWKRTLMHRFILGLQDGERVDHKDNNGLNNVRSNLRKATAGQNQQNSGIRARKGKRPSRFKGVHWAKHVGKWIAQIAANKKHYYLGVFDDEVEAARAYDAKAKQLHGEFAKLNFPE